MNLMNKTGSEVLTTTRLAQLAPAIFAEAPRTGLSNRYSFLKTGEVIEALQGAGWMPVFAGQGKARDLTRAGVQRHVVRFRHGDAQLKIGGVVPELVVVNSHDGSSAYQLHAGIFRFVCGNGMVVADSIFARVSIRHSNATLREVVDASFQVVKDVPKLGESIEAMRAVTLTNREQEIFAESAARLRWDEEKLPVAPAQLVEARRHEDRPADLWSTFNRVQENLVRGGVKGQTTTGRRMRTRAIGSVTEDTKINKALWHLAEEMRRIKTGSAVAA